MTTTPQTDAGLDPLIHEASRLRIVAVLNECDMAGFNVLLGATGLTTGNMSAHISKLVIAGYVRETKGFVGRMPHTEYRLTEKGREVYARYVDEWMRLTNANGRRREAAKQAKNQR